MSNIIKQTFDSKNRLIKKENNNVLYIMEYNDNNQKILQESILNGKINYQKWSYDANNRLIKEDINGTKFIEYKYEDVRFPNTMTEVINLYQNDIKNYSIKYEYNDFELITKCIKSDGFYFEKTYDINGNILIYEDSNNNTTNYYYNEQFKLIEVVEINDGYYESKKIKYIDENKIEKTIFSINEYKDELYETIIEEYDNFNNLIRLINNGEIDEESQYSNDGKILLYQKSDNNETFYNEQGLELKVINHDIDLTIDYIYNSNDKIEKIEYSDERFVIYKYDFNNNQIKEIYSNGTMVEYQNEYLISDLEITNYFDFKSNDLELD